MTSSTPESGKSAADIRPQLVLDWLCGENGDKSLYNYRPGSAKRGNWTCHVCGHKWETSIANRVLRASDCRVCKRKDVNEQQTGVNRPVVYEQSMAIRFPELVPYWLTEENKIRADSVGPGSEYSYHWECARKHRSTGSIYSKMTGMKEQGIFPCKTCYYEDKNKPKPGKSLAEVNPVVAALWHPTLNGTLTPWDVYAHANTYAWWLCENGHDSFALVNSKVNGYACKHCNTYNMSKSEERVRQALATAEIFTSLSDRQVTIPLRWRKRYVAEVDMLGTLPSGEKIVIEYDGAFHHAQTVTVPRDLAKTQALLAAGYLVLRIRERDLFHVDVKHENLFQLNFHFNRLRPDDALPDLVNEIRHQLALR